MAEKNKKNAGNVVESTSEELQKTFEDNVLDAIKAASQDVKGDVYPDVEAALKAAGGDDPFFNPTLSQYREGMVLNTDRNVVKIKKAKVGRRGAWVITCPCGKLVDNKPVYTGAFNMYPSTLRKQIQVTDEYGNPTLDENKQPVVIDGKGNEVWDAARACATPAELLKYTLNKIYVVDHIIRDFGPAVFVEQADKSLKATSHKLTALPIFNLINE